MDRMTDDAAPITPVDVAAARVFLSRLRRAVVVVAGAGLLVLTFTASAWSERQATRAACETIVVARHAELERGPPPDAVLHRGPGVVVVDTPELAALLQDGRVVASTLRCGPDERVPARAWVQGGAR